MRRVQVQVRAVQPGDPVQRVQVRAVQPGDPVWRVQVRTVKPGDPVQPLCAVQPEELSLIARTQSGEKHRTDPVSWRLTCIHPPTDQTPHTK